MGARHLQVRTVIGSSRTTAVVTASDTCAIALQERTG
jgi:hypothetical protein